MNILIVPSWYKTYSKPNSGSFFKEQAIALKNAGNNVYMFYINMVSFKELSHYQYYKLYEYEDDGIKVFQINVPNYLLHRVGLDSWHYQYFYKKYIDEVIFKIGKIDIIHAHATFWAGYSATKYNDNHIPVVVTEHSSAVHAGNLSCYQQKCLKRTVDNANIFICVSPSLKESVIKQTNSIRDIKIIPNLVDDRFTLITEKKEGEFTFCSISNLIPSKKVDLLIEAFKEAFNTNKSVKLYIAGDGIERYKLQNIINKYGLAAQVILLGQLSRDKIFELYKKANAFAMVSESETFGVVYAEAICCGLPCIAVNNGGAEYIIDETNGLLAKKNILNDVVNKMKMLYKNYKSYDRKMISENAKKRFSSENIAKELLMVYEKLIEENNFRKVEE